jgi:integrase
MHAPDERRKEMGVFKKQGVYWIDYYLNGHRKRERIGPDKRLADTVLRKKVEIAEGKFLEKQRPVTTTFNDLAEAYLGYARDQQQKRSWTRDQTSLRTLKAYFGEKRLPEITPAAIEQYRVWRRATISRRSKLVTPATINRELACLKRMFNVARKGLVVLKDGMPVGNPMAMVSLDRERNERDRVLSAEEFRRIYEAAAPWLQPMLLVAYHTGMRAREIRALRWEQVDLKAGTIRLKSTDTKTDEGRLIPLSQTLTTSLKTATRYVRCPWVLVNPTMMDAWQANPEQVDPRYRVTSITHAFERACRKADITHATFHDLRHTFVTNARRAGIDYFRIMAITGHKTMAVFKRYNTIDQQDLQAAICQLDTYMDTMDAKRSQDSAQALENTELGR